MPCARILSAAIRPRRAGRSTSNRGASSLAPCRQPIASGRRPDRERAYPGSRSTRPRKGGMRVLRHREGTLRRLSDAALDGGSGVQGDERQPVGRRSIRRLAPAIRARAASSSPSAARVAHSFAIANEMRLQGSVMHGGANVADTVTPPGAGTPACCLRKLKQDIGCTPDAVEGHPRTASPLLSVVHATEEQGKCGNVLAVAAFPLVHKRGCHDQDRQG